MKYHVNTYGGDVGGFKKGLNASIRFALQGGTMQLLIRIGQLANAKGMMSDVLGDEFVNSLIKTKKKNFSNNGVTISIFLEGNQTKRSGFQSGTVFAPWATRNSLASVLSDHRTVDSVFIPWMEDERDEYITNNPDSTEV